MEALLLGCAGMSSGLAALVLLGEGGGSLSRRLGHWGFAALRCLERAGRSRPVARLLAYGPFGRVALELSERASEHGVDADAGCCLSAAGCVAAALSAVMGLLLASPVAAASSARAKSVPGAYPARLTASRMRSSA